MSGFLVVVLWDLRAKNIENSQDDSDNQSDTQIWESVCPRIQFAEHPQKEGISYYIGETGG